MKTSKLLAPLVCSVLAFAMIVMALPVDAQTWRGRGRLQGKVSLPDGSPAVGATVTLTLGDSGEGPDPITTDDKGRFGMIGLFGGTWNVQIELEGYLIENGTVQVSGVQGMQAKPLNITLAPIPEQAQGPDILGMVEEGNALLQSQQFAEARAKYQEALAELEPKNHPPILMGVARTYFQEENTREALATMDQILEIEPGNVDALKLAIQMASLSGMDDEAEAYMARLPEGETVKLDPGVALNKGIEAYNTGDLETAMGHFSSVVEDNPDLADGYYYRGLIYLQQGDSAAALADFQRFLELDPEHAEAATAREFLSYLEPAE
jgi:tetratricopeptide (TPR) repeat protein